jgi:glutathionyl-hydroquinone reductase
MTGMMMKGKWRTSDLELDANGEYNPKSTTFRNSITADGSSGFKAEAGRYHLYVSLACPWAQRTLIMRELKGLQNVISLSIVDPIMSDQGWMFSDDPDAIPDFVNHATYMHEIYAKADPQYTGRVTVPVLWDKQQQTIVNNESLDIMRMFDLEFAAFATQNIDFYPEKMRSHIDQTINTITPSTNAGVYRAGFAISQATYETAVTQLFEHFYRWENMLEEHRYLCGQQLTEADIGLFPTLYRFDSIYYTLFKCNLRRIVDYPNLWNYLKDLYQRPEFKATCNLSYTKRAYYMSMTDINPNQLIPIGPLLDFDAPHDRGLKFAHLDGNP